MTTEVKLYEGAVDMDSVKGGIRRTADPITESIVTYLPDKGTMFLQDTEGTQFLVRDRGNHTTVEASGSTTTVDVRTGDSDMGMPGRVVRDKLKRGVIRVNNIGRDVPINPQFLRARRRQS